MAQNFKLSRRQFLSLSPALPLTLPSLVRRLNSLPIIAGFFVNEYDTNGWPISWLWIEGTDLAELTDLGKAGYVVIYPAGLDSLWLSEFKAGLQDSFSGSRKTYLPVVFN